MIKCNKCDNKMKNLGNVRDFEFTEPDRIYLQRYVCHDCQARKTIIHKKHIDYLGTFGEYEEQAEIVFDDSQYFEKMIKKNKEYLMNKEGR